MVRPINPNRTSWGHDPVIMACCTSECASERRNAVRRHGRHTIERACEFCGETFTTTRADARYCMSAHRQAAYRERLGR